VQDSFSAIPLSRNRGLNPDLPAFTGRFYHVVLRAFSPLQNLSKINSLTNKRADKFFADTLQV
jgi:hypothetical protein